jgi:acetyl-CoA synthetase
MEPIWYPEEAYWRGSWLERLWSVPGVSDYESFYQWSIQEPARFWAAFLEAIGLRWDRPYSHFVDLSEGLPWARFFVEGALNAAANAVRPALLASPEQVALRWEREDGAVEVWSYSRLQAQVRALMRGWLARGFMPGDRVGILCPMRPEAVVTLLAVAGLGGIAVPLFSGFGPEAVRTRLVDAEARWLVVLARTSRRAQPVDLLRVAREATEGLSPRPVLLVIEPDRALEEAEVPWEVLLEAGSEVSWAPTEAESPCMLLYTSGTTGRPKATVHVHGGFPLKAALDMALLFDVRPGECLFWITDLGWMMGPWAIWGALLLGASVVLYEGAPDWPDAGRIWQVVCRHEVTHLGLSPTLVRALMGRTELVPEQRLASLRIFGSTGEPWNPEPYRWLFERIGGGRRPIINYSGGTEVAGGILGCTIARPIKPTGFNTAVPGMDAVVLDGTGRPVVGEVGELAVRQPWPGMTRGFWRDPGRYLDTYWRRFPGIWVHGDWALQDAEGHWFILGRSDDTIKVGGKRIGPAEIESVAVEHPAVREAAAIGVPHPLKGEAVVLFVVPRSGQEADPALAEALSDFLSHRLGKVLRPERVIVVPDLPRTRNAKILRRLIRAVWLGEDPGDVSALENPEAVAYIRQMARGERPTPPQT